MHGVGLMGSSGQRRRSLVSIGAKLLLLSLAGIAVDGSASGGALRGLPPTHDEARRAINEFAAGSASYPWSPNELFVFTNAAHRWLIWDAMADRNEPPLESLEIARASRAASFYIVLGDERDGTGMWQKVGTQRVRDALWAIKGTVEAAVAAE